MRLFNWISSMKTGLVLLTLIGITSAIGSSIWPDFFQTAGFRFLLLLLLVNMASCTGKSMKSFWGHRQKIYKKKRLLLKRIGQIMLHAGVVFILIGAGIYSWLGQNVELHILEGDTVDIGRIIPAAEALQIKLIDFSIAFNEDGSPSQYYSELEVSSPGKDVYRQTISVNHPLSGSGIKAYQNSYGYLLEMLVKDGNAPQKSELLQEGSFVSFTGSQKTVKVFKYIPDFDPALGLQSKSLQANHPKVAYSVYEGTKLLGAGAASFEEAIEIDQNVVIVFQQARPYTVLTLKSDPGLPLAASGGLMLMLGIIITLFTPVSRRSQQLKGGA